jgi:Fur family ferric uptake transcriptional regulator
MTNEIIKFSQYLRTKGLSLTQERETILNEVFSLEGHFEAEELLFSLRKKKKRVSRATVYRTLDLLVDAGLVGKADMGEKHSHYEHIFGHLHHDHLVCIRCGKVIEFSDKRIERSMKKLCEKGGFEHISHCFQVFGYCKNCR